MGLKSSTLLQEEDIEDIQKETGCKNPKFATVFNGKFKMADLM